MRGQIRACEFAITTAAGHGLAIVRENTMIIRTVLCIAALAISVNAAAAQSNPVEERAELMKAQGKYFYGRLLRDMVENKKPYDQVTVDEAFATLVETTKKLPSLFPETAKGQSVKGDYFASPKVWENKADFDARFVQFAKDVIEISPKAKSSEGLKEAYPAIRKNCDECHEIYRVKKG
jgi:cytochrome c556